MWRRGLVVAALTWAVTGALVTGGCGAGDPDPGDRSPGPETLQAQTSPPPEAVAVLPAEDPAALALGVSQALYDRAPVVVLAGAADPDGQEQAAEQAVALGVPLLLAPPPATPTGEAADPATGATEEPAAELRRLDTRTVIAHGEAAGWADRLGGPEVVAPGGAGDPATAPEVSPPPPLPALTVLAADGSGTVAATATARAAGAQVLYPADADPRTDPEVIAALAAAPPTHTLALGEEFGPADRLRQRLAVASTGVELPGGGQTVFPGRRMVALYGHPGDSGLGALGEQPLAETLERAREVAGEYQDLVDEPVVPTLEIITTLASASAGPQGDYSRRTPVDELREWVEAAGEAGVYVVLDLQPGRTDFLTQAQEYEELLAYPHVGLALDPEWRLAPDQRHMVTIGSVDAAEVNQVVEWLADLTARHQLPQKLLIAHQFQLRMIGDRGELDTSRDELAVLIHADGFGTPSQKLATWNALRADAPEVWWGWKNFYDEDRPTFTPAETVAVEPSPVFISYQ